MDKQVVIDSKPCPGCKRIAKIEVGESGLTAWKNGQLIQRAMPYLTNEQRESLITGYCDPCWNKLFNSRNTENE